MLPRLLSLCALSVTLVFSLLLHASDAANLTFTLLTSSAAFPASEAAGAAFLTTNNASIGGTAYPASSWILLGHGAIANGSFRHRHQRYTLCSNSALSLGTLTSALLTAASAPVLFCRMCRCVDHERWRIMGSVWRGRP